MTIKTHTTIWTQPHGTDEQERTPLGAWSDATADLSNVVIHDVQNVTRLTKGGVTTITVYTTDGKQVDIVLHRAEA